MIHHPVLDQLAAAGVKLGLDRVRSFLKTLDDPQDAYPCVHVAGTNGKGSVTSMVTAALVAADYRTGTNVSPHLENVNERVQLNGKMIDDASLREFIEAHDRNRVDWARSQGIPGIPLTYFEFLTTLSMVVFAQRAVQVGVFEVGMGGRLDATNVLKPVVTAVVSISMDHQDALGDTLDAIAGEKSGIMKRGVPVIVGPMHLSARNVFEARAKHLGCKLWKPGRDLVREFRNGLWELRTPDGVVRDLKLSMRGIHQGGNALVALGILHSLRRQGFHLPDSAIRRGLESAVAPGRIESVAPGLIVDGAHNPAGAEALAAWLATQPRPKNRILLFGVGRERKALEILKPLLPHIDEIVTTRCAHPKAADPIVLAAELDDLDVIIADGGDIDDILPEVYAEADETLVAGSLYLAGAVRSLVRDGAIKGIEPGQGPAVDDDVDDEPSVAP